MSLLEEMPLLGDSSLSDNDHFVCCKEPENVLTTALCGTSVWEGMIVMRNYVPCVVCQDLAENKFCPYQSRCDRED